MAKKSRNRKQRAAAPRQRSVVRAGGQRRRLMLGGLVLLLVVVTVVGLRFYQQRNLPLQLQGAVDNHYVRGTANAAVVIKEFSDYT
jgi:hypothetical protein